MKLVQFWLIYNWMWIVDKIMINDIHIYGYGDYAPLGGDRKKIMWKSKTG